MKLKNIIVALLIGASLHSCDYLDIVPDDTPILANAFIIGYTRLEKFFFGCIKRDCFVQYDYRTVVQWEC